MKKIILMWVCLWCCFVSLIVPKNFDFEWNGMYFSITSDSTVEFTSCYYMENVYKNTVRIPSTVEYEGVTYRVTGIAYGAFQGATELKEVVLPSSVNYINEAAFARCVNLTHVEMPNTITSIGKEAFSGCSSLAKIELPSSLTKVSDGMFYKCVKLSDVTLPPSVTSIGRSAFEACAEIVELHLPSSIADVALNAFRGTTFYNRLPNGDVYFQNIYYEYKGEMPAGTKVNIKEGTTRICNNAFCGCSGLTEVNLPSSVTSIGNYAFEDCTGLTHVTLPSSVTRIGYGAFSSCENLSELVIPSSVQEVGDGVIRYTPYFNNLPDGDVYINKVYYAYKGEMPEGSSVVIKDGTTRISGDAFYGCSGLVNVSLPSSVTSMGDYVFGECSGLTHVEIPSSVTELGYGAFWGCSSLCRVNLSPYITSIQDYTFADCTKLKSVDLPAYAATMGRDVFNGCTGLQRLVLPDSLNCLDFGSFTGCLHLTDIYCKMKTPPDVNDDFYDGFQPGNCTLHVPVGSKERYASADLCWIPFNIVEDDFTGVNALPSKCIKVVVKDGVLQVEAAAQTPLSIYSLNGTCVFNGTVQHLPTLAKGTYLVKVMGQTVKVRV